MQRTAKANHRGLRLYGVTRTQQKHNRKTTNSLSLRARVLPTSSNGTHRRQANHTAPKTVKRNARLLPTAHRQRKRSKCVHASFAQERWLLPRRPLVDRVPAVRGADAVFFLAASWEEPVLCVFAFLKESVLGFFGALSPPLWDLRLPEPVLAGVGAMCSGDGGGGGEGETCSVPRRLDAVAGDGERDAEPAVDAPCSLTDADRSRALRVQSSPSVVESSSSSCSCSCSSPAASPSSSSTVSSSISSSSPALLACAVVRLLPCE